MRYLTWIITLPIALVAISFAVTNREPVTLGLWPLPFQITAPLFILGLGALAVGFIVGGLVAWVAQGRHRAAARRQARRAAQLEAELTRLRAQLDTAEKRLTEATRRHAPTAAALPAPGTPQIAARPLEAAGAR